MHLIKRFLQDCHGGLSPSIAIIMMYLITVCGMGVNAAYLMTQKMRLEGVAEIMAIEAMRGIRDTTYKLEGVRHYAMNRAKEAAGANKIDLQLLKAVTTIQFGTFDQDTMKFVENEANADTAVVTLDFTADTGHPVRRLYYTAAGRFADLSVRRVAQFYHPRCYLSGIIAEGDINFQSNVSMYGKYCLRSNGSIKLNSSWTLGDDGIISVAPDSEVNSQLHSRHADSGVLQYRFWDLQFFHQFGGYLGQVRRGVINRPYLTSKEEIEVFIPRIGKRKPWRHASPEDFHKGRINFTRCWNKDTLVLNGDLYSDMILITNCKIDITRGVSFDNMMLITSNANAGAIDAREGLRLGSHSRNCTGQSGTVFMARGGFDVAGSIILNGAQLIAYADRNHNVRYKSRNKVFPTQEFKGNGRIEMRGSVIMSGGKLKFGKNVLFNDCSDRTYSGLIRNKYTRTGVY